MPHHFMDVLESDESYGGRISRMAIGVLRRSSCTKTPAHFYRGHRTVLAGAAGRLGGHAAKVRGVAENACGPASKNVLPDTCIACCRRLDPESAPKIASADEQKLMRAIEVCLLTKRPLSEVHRQRTQATPGMALLKIGLMPAREELYERVHARTDAMLERRLDG